MGCVARSLNILLAFFNPITQLIGIAQSVESSNPTTRVRIRRRRTRAAQQLVVEESAKIYASLSLLGALFEKLANRRIALH